MISLVIQKLRWFWICRSKFKTQLATTLILIFFGALALVKQCWKKSLLGVPILSHTQTFPSHQPRYRAAESEVATNPSCNPLWRSSTWSEQIGSPCEKGKLEMFSLWRREIWWHMFSIVSNGFYMILLSLICGSSSNENSENTLIRENRMDWSSSLQLWPMVCSRLFAPKRRSFHHIPSPVWQVPHAACEVFHALHATQRL